MKLDSLSNSESESVLLEAEMLMRDSLMKILQSYELIAHFSKKDREDFLDRLPFQSRQ